MVSLMRLIILLLFAFASAHLSYAKSTYSIHCPHQIAVHQEIEGNYPGWSEAAQEKRYFLNAMNLFDDIPEKLALLRPDENKQGYTWSLNENEQYYIVCLYDNTSIRLKKKLQYKTTDCVVATDKQEKSLKGPIPLKMVCHKN